MNKHKLYKVGEANYYYSSNYFESGRKLDLSNGTTIFAPTTHGAYSWDPTKKPLYLIGPSGDLAERVLAPVPALLWKRFGTMAEVTPNLIIHGSQFRPGTPSTGLLESRYLLDISTGTTTTLSQIEPAEEGVQWYSCGDRLLGFSDRYFVYGFLELNKSDPFGTSTLIDMGLGPITWSYSPPIHTKDGDLIHSIGNRIIRFFRSGGYQIFSVGPGGGYNINIHYLFSIPNTSIIFSTATFGISVNNIYRWYEGIIALDMSTGDWDAWENSDVDFNGNISYHNGLVNFGGRYFSSYGKYSFTLDLEGVYFQGASRPSLWDAESDFTGTKPVILQVVNDDNGVRAIAMGEHPVEENLSITDLYYPKEPFRFVIASQKQASWYKDYTLSTWKGNKYYVYLMDDSYGSKTGLYSNKNPNTGWKVGSL